MFIDKYHLTFHLRENLKNVFKNMVEGSQLCEPSFGGTRLLASLHGYRARNTIIFGCFLAIACTWPDWFKVFVVLCPGAPKSSTDIGSGLNVLEEVAKEEALA